MGYGKAIERLIGVHFKGQKVAAVDSLKVLLLIDLNRLQKTHCQIARVNVPLTSTKGPVGLPPILHRFGGKIQIFQFSNSDPSSSAIRGLQHLLQTRTRLDPKQGIPKEEVSLYQ
jgi:hypothetical protein